ncbi:MAG: hypothetical protein KIT42_05105 [Rhodocyclaceae bacterium]|nr:hypothetical protein [Rhodocyclaceae bacterium]
MNLQTEQNRQLHLAEWIDTHLSREYRLTSRAEQLSHPCFDLAIEHHAAICLLQDAKLFGSMYALVRVQLEALVNGLWLRHVATENDLKKYESDERVGFGTRVDAIEQQLGTAGGLLSYLKKEQWDIFCSFTHSGYQSILRRVGETHTGSGNYKPEEIVTALRHSGLYALMAAVELASMVGDKGLIDDAMQVLKGYGENEV